jgi:hypothetical protein
MSSIPESLRSNIDLFEDTGLEDPFPLYRRLRDIRFSRCRSDRRP